MSFVLTEGKFGESAIHFVRLLHKGDRQELRDLSVQLLVQGDFERGYREGQSLPLESERAIAERVYALAHEHAGDQIEPFALALCDHVLRFFPRVREAEAEIAERLWSRVDVGGRPHNRAFSATGERRLARVRRSGDSSLVEAGFADLPVMKVITVEGRDALLSGVLSCRWRYGWTDVPFGLHWQQVRQVLMDTFANHDAGSIHQLLHDMAQAALNQTPAITEVMFSMRVRHHHAVDLSFAGMDVDPDLLVPQEGPFSVIEATMLREV